MLGVWRARVDLGLLCVFFKFIRAQVTELSRASEHNRTEAPRLNSFRGLSLLLLGWRSKNDCNVIKHHMWSYHILTLSSVSEYSRSSVYDRHGHGLRWASSDSSRVWIDHTWSRSEALKRNLRSFMNFFKWIHICWMKRKSKKKNLNSWKPSELFNTYL